MKLRTSSLVVVLALSACGGGGTDSSACDALTKGYDSLTAKAAPCGLQLPPLGYTTSQCRQAASNSGCSSADKQKITDYGNCLSALPTCAPATENDWATQVSACDARLQGLSNACG